MNVSHQENMPFPYGVSNLLMFDAGAYSHIRNSFKTSIIADEDESDIRSQASDQLTAYEKVQLWKTDTGDFEEIAGFTPDELPPEGEDELSDGSDLFDGIDDYSEAWDFVFGSLAFSKLRARITRAAILTPRTGQVIDQIRDFILNALSSQSMEAKTRSSLPKLLISTFHISWNPLHFLRSQYEPECLPELQHIVTINGSAVDAQAATCGEYVEQVWPETGREILRALQDFTTLNGHLDGGNISKLFRLGYIC
jgi:hypothetical protein